MMIDLFAAESMLLRIMKIEQRSDMAQPKAVYEAMLQVFFHDVTARMSKNATDAIASFTEGDLLKTFLMGVKRYTKYPPTNVKTQRRVIAEALREANGWCF